MTAFLTDLFNDIAGTRVDAHTSDSGSGWDGPWGSPSGCKINGTKGYIEGAASNAGMRSTAVPPGADYYVEAVFTRVDTGGTLHGCALYIRHSAADLTCYRLSWDSSAGTWGFRRFDAGGAGTAIGTTTADSWGAGVSKTVRVEVVGQALTGKVDGVTVATATDATISAAGRCGFLLYSDNGAAAAGMQIDSITADVASGPTGDPAGLGVRVVRPPRRTPLEMWAQGTRRTGPTVLMQSGQIGPAVLGGHPLGRVPIAVYGHTAGNDVRYPAPQRFIRRAPIINNPQGGVVVTSGHPLGRPPIIVAGFDPAMQQKYPTQQRAARRAPIVNNPTGGIPAPPAPPTYTDDAAGRRRKKFRR